MSNSFDLKLSWSFTISTTCERFVLNSRIDPHPVKCESWTITAELQRRIQAMEVRCYCKILCISHKDDVTNEEVRAKIQQVIGPPYHVKETQTAVVWSCLPFIRSGQNHLARHSERGEEDKADRGRHGKTTLGNGQALSPQRVMENREKWRKLVAKSSVVPRRPSRLRNR